MSESTPKKHAVLTGWFENGPWFAKTVLIALVVAVVGLWFWYSDVRNGPPNGAEYSTNTTQSTSGTPAGATSVEPPSKWSKPFPAYVRISLSYVAGFCIGWLFRRLLRLLLLVGILAVGLFAYGKFTGMNLKPAQEQVKRGSEWAQHEAAAAKDYFKHLLPSATAAGIGIFLGFLRRNRTRESKSAA